MVIIQKLIQALGILPGHGIGTDGTLLQGLLQSGLFFINSFCSCNGNPQIKDQEQLFLSDTLKTPQEKNVGQNVDFSV